MLLNKGQLDGVRVLSPKTVELMTTNHVPAAALAAQPIGIGLGPGTGYGLGVIPNGSWRDTSHFSR
jgi:hypothetical protein